MSQRLRIGRYEVLAVIDSGGMAELSLAYFTGPGGFRKFVALKRILPTHRNNEDFVAMFLDEARITAALSHENIAQVYELGEENDELYLAMEFIAGQDLARIIRFARRAGEHVPVWLSSLVMRQVCQALHYAHHFTSPAGRPLPVIHRDLSPRNVMVTYAGNTRVIDFGIAKARGSLSTTSAGQVKGSTPYMSPEQVRGDELDGRSDLFSAGVCLYEALTATRPWGQGADATVMYAILNKEPVPPRELNPAVPQALSDVVMRALAKSPENRFATGREMARAIDEASGCRAFDEEAVSTYVSRHFAETMKRTNAVLSEVSHDEENAALMIEALKEEPSGQMRERVQMKPPAAEDRPTISTSQLAQARPASVLVVDDSTVLRAVVERLLSVNGYTVFTATTGAEALATLEQIQPDILILDVRMDGMDGFELCQKVRARPATRGTPIVFLSAACSLEERVKGLSVGGDDFVRKPFEPDDLLARIRVHLHRVAVAAKTTAVG